MHFRHYSLRIKISFKVSFPCSLKLILIKKFHGTFSRVPWNFLNNTCGSIEFLGTWATKPQVPWNSMEVHGILSRSKVPWNSMELFPYSRVPWNSMELLIFSKKVPWNSMEFNGNFFKFHGIPWNSMELDKFHILKKHIFEYCFWYLIDD